MNYLRFPLAICLSLVVFAGFAASSPLGDAEKNSELRKQARSFLTVYRNREASKLKKFFAPKIDLYGDIRALVLDKEKGVSRALKVSREELALGYVSFFKKVGEKKWTLAMKDVEPTIAEVKVADPRFPALKMGDFIYDLHFRKAIKGKDRGLDEVIMFVFRKVDKEWLIIAHIVDF